jgi:colanic acid biosynthesis glycosyl transferase WcaI
MRIAYLTQWFEPEPNIIKGIGFVRALVAAGHEVGVVTGLPNYPTGRLYPGYHWRFYQRETIAGAAITRLPLYPSHDASSLRRALNFSSFFVSVLLWLLVRRRRCDLAYVYHPPITVGLAAALAGLVRRLPFVLDIQDLWPDTLTVTGMPGAARIAPLVSALCDFVYRRAAAIVVQSEGMRRALLARGVPASKISVIHNWALVEPIISAPPVVDPTHPFTIVYGGNLGRAQALDTVVEAAAILATTAPAIVIELYGDGVEAAALRAHAARLGLGNVRFHGQVAQDRITVIFAGADALLLHLADNPLFAITIPSKTQAYLAMGRPIIAGIAGEAARLLGRSGAAQVVAPQDAGALAAVMQTLSEMPADELEAMGTRGREFYHAELSFAAGMAQTLAVLAGTNAKERPPFP